MQVSGFKHWKVPERNSVHENAKNHRECFTQWRELERILAEHRFIDAELQSQIENEKQNWRDILMRISHCIKYYNLAFESLHVSRQTV